MKGKLFIMVAALMSAFTLSSCLGDSETMEYPTYERMVTVGPGALYLYSDGGELLKPTNTVTGLDKVERAVVAFDVVPAELNGTKLESGKSYDITMNPNYYYSVPTQKIINLHDNAAAVDSLENTQDPIAYVENLYVKNGYLTAYLSYNMNRFGSYYIDMAYDAETDVDPSTNTITFTLYYDNKADYGDISMKYPFSFRMPMEAYDKLPAEEVNVVVRYKTEHFNYSTVTCKMKKSDFNTPIY